MGDIRNKVDLGEMERTNRTTQKIASLSKKNRKSQPHTQKRRKKEKLRKSPTNDEIKLP